MKRRVLLGSVVLICAFGAATFPGRSASPRQQTNAEKTDYSKEAYVIESRSTETTFENDGTSTTIVKGRVRIQSQAGVQAFGVLTLPYASAVSTIEVTHVRVIKPDGRTVETPADNAVDMPADITRQAPFYSDLKVLQVAVKGLQVGDIIEFESRNKIIKPLDPGQFWEVYNFLKDGIVLQETIDLRVPRNRAVQIKTAKAQPTISDDGPYRLYHWSNSNLSHVPDKEASAADSLAPDVQITSFQNWDEVGQWVQGLFAPRAAVTPEIQAKAAELTRAAKTDDEKIQAIYAFVSTKFRYIGIAFGIGRLQPHSAADILTNDYGDCKDKHTLLTSLLAAAGVTAYPALINSQAKMDPDVPSPAQFDHVITAVPRGKGFLFLDATPEVAPFGFLTANLRDKKTLIVTDRGTQLIQTPADPPFPSFFHFEANGTIDALGTLQAKMQMSLRGDIELLYRLALRQAGQSEWNDVVQKVSQNLGFGGTVTDVSATSPEETETPFQISYSYKREKYSDWDDRQIAPPFPPLDLADAPDEKDTKGKPFQLGSPVIIDCTAAIHLPPNSSPQLPASIHLNEEFAEYTATYSFSGGVLHAERKLEIKAHELSSGQLLPYRAFIKAILNDEHSDISLSGGSALAADISGSPEARELNEQAHRAWESHNWAAEEGALQQAVEKDPNFAQAWLALGTLHAYRGQPDKAIEELKKAIALEPNQTPPYQALTTLLIKQHRPEDALMAWKELEKAAPQNPDAPEHVAAILMTLKRYSEAATEFEAALRLDPDKPILQVGLGEAYARSGQKDKALATVKKVIENEPTANDLNGVAYFLADTNIQLNQALDYAERAVQREEGETVGTDLGTLREKDLRAPSSLAAYWDTLGWVHYRMGQLDQAEKYIDAAWRLAQDPIVGDHLGQIYEKEGKRQKAMEAYSRTLATGHAPDETKARLDALPPGNAVTAGVLDLQNMRMTDVDVSPKPKKHVSAEFFMLLVPGPKVADIRFLNAGDEFTGARKALQDAHFDAPFPDDNPAQILRRGIIDCEPELPHCTIALIPVSSVRTVN